MYPKIAKGDKSGMGPTGREMTQSVMHNPKGMDTMTPAGTHLSQKHTLPVVNPDKDTMSFGRAILPKGTHMPKNGWDPFNLR